jgi:acrylyl-CoA reductase (NADPH)
MTSLTDTTSVFRAIRIDQDAVGGVRAAYVDMREQDLMDGEIDLEVTHSAINFKDGLAITGLRPVVRRFPMVPGVDLAGRVRHSSHKDFASGDLVVATGCGLGEAHYGGFAERARLSPEWLVKLPPHLTPQRAMAVGTAGLTAMLCLLAIEKHGLSPADGPAVVTGAAGGVGSFAVALMAHAGWRVTAVTGRASEEDYLRKIGAENILMRDSLTSPGKALQTQRFAAGIDTVGGQTLANLLAQTQADCAIAACGNVGGMEAPMSVAPFILRGVALLGVESVRPRLALRREAWLRIARDLDPNLIDALTEVIPFDQALERAKTIVAGAIRGRVVVAMPQK